MEMYELYMMGFSIIMTLILVVSIGGVVLLRPVMKHLGQYLQARADERQALAGRSPEDWERLFTSLETFGRRLEALEERQDFTEKLLARPGREEGEG